jgi:PKHD-type hydroxylase
MYLNNYYWFFEGAVPSRICDDIVKLGEERQSLQAVTGMTEEETKKTDVKNQRDSSVSWLSEPWVYEEINPYIHSANMNAGWGFEWSWNEPCQYTKYSPGQFYDWHQDMYQEPLQDEHNPNLHGKFRKLSMSLMLNDGSEYEGGDFQFDYRNYHPTKVSEKDKIITADQVKKKGSILVFPSFVWHRVTKVTKGTRCSLVNWSVGAKFI